jgi:hypothetical protein
MSLDGGDQEVDVVGPAGIDFVVDNDLILGLLELDQLAELGGLAGLALADHLGRRLE